MRILWVNNVSDILGGTLQATHSMIASLPKATHRVFSFGGSPNSECRSEFEKVGARIERGTRAGLDLTINEFRPELCVLQNIAVENLPTPTKYTHFVYYLHSEAGKRAAEMYPDHLCVSKYLAQKVGWDEATVLYQPVVVPPVHSRVTDLETVFIGKFGTQRKEYWKEETYMPVVEALGDKSAFQIEAVTNFEVPVAVHRIRPSVAAKSYLHDWDYLLAFGKVETYGRTIREAQLCGCLPIVEAGSGGPVELVEQFGGYIAKDVRDAVELILSPSTAYAYAMRPNPIGTCEWWREQFIERLSRFQRLKEKRVVVNVGPVADPGNVGGAVGHDPANRNRVSPSHVDKGGLRKGKVPEAPLLAGRNEH